MPLHRGHQLLIESALAQVDHLTVVVYNNRPDGIYPSMPIEKRMNWIAELYPQIENIVAQVDPLDELTGSKADHDDPKYALLYADDLAFLGQFDYVFSSEDYGAPFAKALGATHVTVDTARTMLPISGTQIREHVYENRGWMDGLVYRSLIQKVVFVGTESTGKSTLAKLCAEKFDTKWVHEYGRELWEAQGGEGSFADLLKIGETQTRREEAAALHANEFLFCDTNAWITLQWSLMYHGTADARLIELAESTKDDYIWFVCDDDFDWVDDGSRELKDGKAAQFQKQIQRNLNILKPKHVYWDLKGTPEKRAKSVVEALALFHRDIKSPKLCYT